MIETKNWISKQLQSQRDLSMQLVNNEDLTAQFLRQLFIRLNDAKVDYCVLRNYEDLPEKIGNDIDLWVNKNQQDRFKQVLVDTMNNLGWDLIAYFFKLRAIGSGDYFIKKEDPSLTILHLDLCFYHWKGLAFFDENAPLNKTVKTEKGFYVPLPGVEASILLLKSLIYSGHVQEKYKKRIIDFSNKDPDSFLLSIQKPFGCQTAKSILDLAKRGDWHKLEKKTTLLRWQLIVRSLCNDSLDQIKIWCIYFYDQVKKYFFHNRGIFIVLLGPDGSGKSTISSELIKSEVRRLFQNKLAYHGHFPFLPRLKKIMPFIKHKHHQQQHHEIGYYAYPFHPLRAMVYPLYYGINYFIGHIMIWLEKARGGLVIFDRYFYDYYIQRQYDKCPRWFLGIISRLVPLPDLIICLDNEPEKIFERKHELSVEEIERQLNACRALTKNMKNTIIVNTAESLELSVNKIQKKILSIFIMRQKRS
ncbi:MAG: hypothetical protein NT099_07090 [Candidatus Saganbacteria bacterium]|nr:hypothetical protein [Candidatus Saganbacteria bacterium]